MLKESDFFSEGQLHILTRNSLNALK